jgi:hypothetical protein
MVGEENDPPLTITEKVYFTQFSDVLYASFNMPSRYLGDCRSVNMPIIAYTSLTSLKLSMYALRFNHNWRALQSPVVFTNLSTKPPLETPEQLGKKL